MGKNNFQKVTNLHKIANALSITIPELKQFLKYINPVRVSIQETSEISKHLDADDLFVPKKVAFDGQYPIRCNLEISYYINLDTRKGYWQIFEETQTSIYPLHYMGSTADFKKVIAYAKARHNIKIED